jgi:hypothetical protein
MTTTWTLVREDSHLPVEPGDTVFNFRGEAAVVTGGRPPQHQASTGRVWVDGGAEYFPSVFGLVWIRGCANGKTPLPRAIECA